MLKQLSLEFRLPDNARFDNFFPGPNAEIVSQVQLLQPGQSLYLHGGPQSGRSHLLQAACRQAGEQGGQACYMPLKLLRDASPEVLEDVEQAGFLALDDVDVIAADKRWEEACFHLFNRAQAAGATLVLSAGERPAAAGFELPDLASRLGWGMVYGLKTLTDSDRLEVLRLRARQRGLEMPEEVAQFLLRRLPRGLTALCSLIDRLDQASLAAQRRLTIPFVKSVLRL